MSLPGFRGYFREDELARAVYSEAAGIGRAIPSAVAVPVDAEDVVVLVKWAAGSGTSLIPRGSGSSMSGAAIGTGHRNEVIALDVRHRGLRQCLQAGVVGPHQAQR